MATLDPLTNPIKAVIYKKTLNNDQVVYVPYLPRTDAEWVSLNESITVHSTSYVANTDLETIIKGFSDSIGVPTSTASSATNSSLQAQINYISQELISKSGAFIYKGSGAAQATAETPLDLCHRILGSTTTPVAGWVFNISNNFKVDSSGRLVASSDGDAYKGGTNIVIIGSGTASDPFKFDALGGDMGNHALTSEAIGSATLSGNTITFKYVNNQTAGTISFGTIGTTAASTIAITSTITTTTPDSSIPNVAAVKSYAGSASQVDVTKATNGYLTVVPANTDSTQTIGVVSIAVSSGQSTTPTLGANISGTAAQADKLTNTLTFGGTSGANPGTFDGASSKSVLFEGAFSVSTSGTTTSVEVKATSGLTATTAGVGIDNTVTAGVYSAVAVNQYGLATAGGQAVVFANSLDDPDLNQLVVGGLAFVSTSETAKTGTIPASNIDLDN